MTHRTEPESDVRAARGPPRSPSSGTSWHQPYRGPTATRTIRRDDRMRQLQPPAAGVRYLRDAQATLRTALVCVRARAGPGLQVGLGAQWCRSSTPLLS